MSTAQRTTRSAALRSRISVTSSRATYGYRRVWAMVNRTFRVGYNRKRIRRVMQLHGLMLAPRIPRRHGRPHLGQIQQPASNQRWCSDIFLIPCWSGEVLSVAFAIDCHDREVFAWTASPRPLNGGDIRTLMDKALWARFGDEAPGIVYDPETLRQSIDSFQPIGRPGEPREIANVALFLASDEARYITGASLPIDAGASVV